MPKQKKFDKQKHIKALSRSAMGQPPKSKVVVSKKDKPTKHKKKIEDDREAV